LLQLGHHVRVLDLLLYTSAGVDALKRDPLFAMAGRFELIRVICAILRQSKERLLA
jgi:hypothetical protein